jgi:hypothetical protein
MSNDLCEGEGETASVLADETNSTSEPAKSYPRKRRSVNGHRMQMRGTQEAKRAAALKHRRRGEPRQRQQPLIRFPASFSITAVELDVIDLVMGEFVRRLLKED